MVETNDLSSAAKPNKADLVALIFAFFFPTLVTLIYFQWLKDSESSLQQTAMGIGKVLQFGFPVVWVWMRHRHKIFRQSSNNAQESAVRSANDIWIGVGFGIMVTVAMFSIYFLMLAPTAAGANLTVMIKEKVSGMGIDAPWKYIGLGCFYALCHSFLEEYYWRWFVFDLMESFVSTVTANILSSLGFMAHHVVLMGFFFGWSSPWTYLLSACVAIGGSFWAWQFKTTGSLRAPWVSHLIVDAGIFSLGYFLIRDLL